MDDNGGHIRLQQQKNERKIVLLREHYFNNFIKKINTH